MQWMTRLETAQTLALEAGRLALSLQSNLTVRHKPHDHGPVSNGDLAADQVIREGLKERFPKDTIVTEESFTGTVAPVERDVWYVDPIDGTSSYILGRSDFVVMIGLAHQGKAVLGVVYQPASDTMWSGIHDADKALNWCQKERHGLKSDIKPTRRSELLPPSELTLMASRTSRAKRQAELIKALKPHNVIYQSSVGFKAMMVLEGEADLYVCWSRQVKLWDTCAATAIIKAAGFFMGHIDGTELVYEGPISHGHSLMVANAYPGAPLLAMLKDIDELSY